MILCNTSIPSPLYIPFYNHNPPTRPLSSNCSVRTPSAILAFLHSSSILQSARIFLPESARPAIVLHIRSSAVWKRALIGYKRLDRTGLIR